LSRSVERKGNAPPGSPESVERVSPDYTVIAEIYDRMMSHVAYGDWAEHVRNIWERHAAGRFRSCLDAACGTGRFLEILREQGVELWGMDVSEKMLELARSRLGSGESPAPGEPVLFRADLRDFRPPRRFELVTCLYDSVNYLLSMGELVAALRNLAGCLERNGLLVFDICTERNSLEHFLDYREERKLEGWEYKRHSWYDRNTRIHHNDFEVRKLSGGGRRREFHRQRIYRVREMDRAVREAGLALVNRYAEFTFRRGGESADRVHYVARLPGGSNR